MAEFGKISIGASGGSYGADLIVFGGRHQISENGDITNVLFWTDDNTSNYVLGVYEDVAGAPGNLLAFTTSGQLGGSASAIMEWRGRSGALNTVIHATGGSYFWLAATHQTLAGTNNINHDAATGKGRWAARTYDGTLPATLTSLLPLNDLNQDYNIKAIYTPTGGGGPTAPTITSVTPSSIVPNASAPITFNVGLVGTGFDVTLAGAPAAVTFSNTTSITKNSQTIN